MESHTAGLWCGLLCERKAKCSDVQFPISGSVFVVQADPKESQLAVTGGEDDKAFVWKIADGSQVMECTGRTPNNVGYPTYESRCTRSSWGRKNARVYCCAERQVFLQCLKVSCRTQGFGDVRWVQSRFHVPRDW